MPLLPPTTMTPKINAMIWIGVRDTLFNYNNGYHNYSCLKQSGGDVRLLSYQAGHNSANIIADPGLAFLPSQDNQDTSCGSVSEDAATLAFFDEYLRGKTGASNAIPRQPCISLSAGDGVLVPQVATGNAGVPFDIGSLTVVAGAQVDTPMSTATLVTGGPNGTVIAGIPHVTIGVAATTGTAVGEPILFLALAVQHAGKTGVYDYIDNQVTPVRGIGRHDIDLIGGGVRLAPGDQLSLVAYGGQDQYVYSGSINTAKPAVVPVTITGNVYVPIATNAMRI